VSEEASFPVSVTLKGGTGFESPWIVLRGGTAEEVLGEVQKLDADDTFLEAVATVAKAFHRIYAPASAAPAQAAPAAQQQASNGPRLHPQGKKCESANCGQVLTWQTWEKKDGSRTFNAFRCPTAKFGHTADFQTK